MANLYNLSPDCPDPVLVLLCPPGKSLIFYKEETKKWVSRQTWWLLRPLSVLKARLQTSHTKGLGSSPSVLGKLSVGSSLGDPSIDGISLGSLHSSFPPSKLVDCFKAAENDLATWTQNLLCWVSLKKDDNTGDRKYGPRQTWILRVQWAKDLRPEYQEWSLFNFLVLSQNCHEAN